MTHKIISTCTIYVGTGAMEGVPGFIYIRAFREGKIGFSVLDEPEVDPDFSESGIFWMDPEAFVTITKPFIDSCYADYYTGPEDSEQEQDSSEMMKFC